LHHGLGSRKFGQQRLHFVSWALFDQKLKDDADGLLRSRTIYADVSDQTCDQFVHYCLASRKGPFAQGAYCRVTGGRDKQAAFEDAQALQTCNASGFKNG
jgi:hypothetical protein